MVLPPFSICLFPNFYSARSNWFLRNEFHLCCQWTVFCLIWFHYLFIHIFIYIIKY
jgi:hypothetical protein